MASKFSLCGGKNICYFSEQGNVRYFSEEQFIRFKPPKQETYKIQGSRVSNYGQCFIKVAFLIPEYNADNFPKHIKVSCYNLYNDKKNIICLHIKNNSINESQQKRTIIYSHSHSTDIGVILPMLVDFSVQFRADIITYDYSGYGRSSGKPSLNNLTENIDVVMEFVSKDLKIDMNNIYLFGRDLGAIPSCFISLRKNINFKGMILFSPLFGDEITHRTLKEITLPTLVIHGSKDTSFSHIKLSELCKNIRNGVEWYPKAENPDAIILNYRRKFFSKIKDFFVQIQGRKSSKNFLLLSGTSNESLVTSYISDNNLEIKQNASLNIVESNFSNTKTEDNFFQTLDKSSHHSGKEEDFQSKCSRDVSKVNCTLNYGNDSNYLEYDDGDDEDDEDSD